MPKVYSDMNNNGQVGRYAKGVTQHECHGGDQPLSNWRSGLLHGRKLMTCTINLAQKPWLGSSWVPRIESTISLLNR